MKNLLFLLKALLLVVLGGCQGDDEGGVNYISFENFEDEVAASVDSTAVDCGTVEINEPQLAANTCAAEAFSNGQTFYAVYRLQGIDSSVGSAITLEADGSLYLWSYDDNPAGGASQRPLDSRVVKERCDDAELSGSLDGGYRDVFVCSDS